MMKGKPEERKRRKITKKFSDLIVREKTLTKKDELLKSIESITNKDGKHALIFTLLYLGSKTMASWDVA